MKKLIINVNRDLQKVIEERKLKGFLFKKFVKVFDKASRGFFIYIRSQMRNSKSGTFEEGEEWFKCTVVDDDYETEKAEAKLSAFLHGDYQKCKHIMEQERYLKKLPFWRMLRIVKGTSLLKVFYFFGVYITWKMEDVTEENDM